MSLDYWRNEDKDIRLGIDPPNSSNYYLISEVDGGEAFYRLSSKDLEHLKTSIDFLLRTE